MNKFANLFELDEDTQVLFTIEFEANGDVYIRAAMNIENGIRSLKVEHETLKSLGEEEEVPTEVIAIGIIQHLKMEDALRFAKALQVQEEKANA